MAASSSATCATPSGPATCCREIPIADLLQMMKKAGDLYAKAELPLGDGTQTPDQFVRMQSATTGLPEHMCRFNMEKNHFVLEPDGQDPRLADARPRPEHPVARLRRRGARRAGQLPGPVAGARAWCCRATRPASTRCGCRSFRCRSAWSSSPARRSRGRRTAWPRPSSRPACRSRPSPSIPASATSAPPCWHSCPRSLIFGGTATVEQYKGNPRVQAHGPGFSKILLGDDEVDDWREVPRHHGRQRLRQQRPRLHQLLRHLGVAAHRKRSPRPSPSASARSQPLPPEDPKSAAGRLHRARPGRRRLRRHRQGPQGSRRPRHDGEVRRPPRQEGALRLPAADGHSLRLAGARRSPRRNTCSPSARWSSARRRRCSRRSGRRWSARRSREDKKFQRALLDATHIDRLNIGPIPTIQLNWLQPHEGSIVDFLFRARAFQFEGPLPG